MLIPNINRIFKYTSIIVFNKNAILVKDVQANSQFEASKIKVLFLITEKILHFNNYIHV